VDNFTLEVADGASVALLGPSGCGKTTLLRIIAGLEPPDSGTVSFDGQDVTDVPPRDRGIGLVFQSYALYPQMESRGNLGFFFKMHRRSPEIGKRIAAVSEIMGPGFRELLDRRPKELSGGQQQRVAIGRCIVHESRVLLFDEPLSNLDAQLRAKTRVELKRLIRRFGITTVYVTHDQAEAFAICDRVAVMHLGRLEQYGTYDDIYDRPQSLFVAGFVGYPSMNLFRGVLEAGGLRVVHGDRWHLDEVPCALPAETTRADAPTGSAAPVVLPLSPALAASLPAGASLTVGLRPDAFRLASPGEHGLEARVEVSEPLMAERRQVVTCAVASSPGGLEIVAKLDVAERLAPGTPLRLAFDPDRLHCFGQDGQRLSLPVLAHDSRPD
jgi:ABC-type sugar transport system ATPase subunit